MKLCLFVFAFLLLSFVCSQNVTKHIPVYGMMELTTVTNDGRLNNFEKIKSKLTALKKINTDGIMLDFWWGIIEKTPKKYNWTPYLKIAELCKEIGLKLQVVMSFHQCGGNVNDDCHIPIPDFVRNVGNHPFYKDRSGKITKEYISLGADEEPIFGGRTPVQMYKDYMVSFKYFFRNYLGSVITSIEVGLGPAGELRYPSYPEGDGRWKFPGIGEFQCYDQFMLKKLKDHANKIGKPEWGHGGPSNAGHYRDVPHHIPFYNRGTNHYESEYGKFFLKWYSSELIEHGRKILSIANELFTPVNTEIGAKIAGIHWWYNTAAHAPELTAGYYHTRNHNGYKDIAKMLKSVNAEFLFTCLEMYDSDMHGCGCSPEGLVAFTRSSAWNEGVHYSGENALPSGNTRGYDQIVRQSKVGKGIHGFTYLRLFDWLFEPENFKRFENFVKRMH